MSVPESGRMSPPPMVGVVVARDENRLGESFRGESGAGRHAEFGLLRRLADVDLAGATLYTTLEPCSRRNHPKIPCAQHVVERGIRRVFIGMYDPDPRIYRVGWRLLRDAGVELRDFPSDLRAEIGSTNSRFVESFFVGIGDRGRARFDYLQNDGTFTVETTDVAAFRTRWTACSGDCIYAYDAANLVAHARYATAFDEIDDPGALDYASYSVRLAEGEIGAFRNGRGYLLVRVLDVLAGPERGDDRWELQFDWEARPVFT